MPARTVLRFRSLGSGSTGNATLVEAGGPRPTRLLIDCGLGPRVLAQRLAATGLHPEDLDGIFLTHEHSDHVGCAFLLSERLGLPVWTSEGTWRACGTHGSAAGLRLCRSGDVIELHGLQLRPFGVPHDAAEPLQLTLSDGNRRLGVLTDLGHAPPDVRLQLQGVHALMLECNHDSELLAQSSYPTFLQRRVGGDLGHLSNDQAADIAHGLRGTLQRLLAAHLSLKNNRAELAEAALRAALGEGVEIAVASATAGSLWMEA